MASPIHRCTDRHCPVYRQPTRPSCRCHKTAEQMLTEAIQRVVVAFDDWNDGQPISVELSEALDAARAYAPPTRVPVYREPDTLPHNAGEGEV